jgi:hypothetical protein
MGKIVHFVIRVDIQAGSLQVVVDHNAQGRGRIQRYDECFAHDLLQLDGIMRGKAEARRIAANIAKLPSNHRQR